MKKTVLIVLMSLASLSAQVQPPDSKINKTTKKTTAPSPKAAPSSVATAIPKDAEALGSGKYRVVDSSGTAWIYQESPFGITKTPETVTKAQTAQNSAFGVMKPADPASSAHSSPFGASMTGEAGNKPQESATSGVTAFPTGNEIRFEKQSPFGKSTWTRKRSDVLTEVEKNALAAAEKTTATSGKN
jgi:hypothetical protein